MQDRVPLYPGRVKLTPVSGQENTYDMVRADEPTQEGDPLSKATFLKDATAALFGLDATAVPDDALALLSRFQKGLGNEYVWERTASVTTYSCSSADRTNTRIVRAATTVYYGDGFNVTANGFVLKNEKTLTVTSSDWNVSSTYDVLKGKYIISENIKSGYASNGDAVLYIPANASITLYSGSIWVRESEGQILYTNITSETKTESFGYVNSPDPAAYPPSVSDGYTYTALGQLGAKVQIATGSYTGTGTYGSSNPNSLTFDFEPKVVFIDMADDTTPAWPYLWGCQNLNLYPGTWVNCYVTISGKTMSWYRDDSNAGNQLNKSGKTYQYIAIG